MARPSSLQFEFSNNMTGILDGDENAVNVTAPGVKYGDFGLVGASGPISDLLVTAECRTDEVRLHWANNTGSTVDLGTTTWYILVLPRDSS